MATVIMVLVVLAGLFSFVVFAISV